MITERLTFEAKYGHGDELAQLFREWVGSHKDEMGGGGRIYTDVTGAMFRVILEADFEDMEAYARFLKAESGQFGTAEFAAWFKKMEAVTKHGERELLNMERVG